MRDLGFNLRILHRNTDMTKLYANFVAFDMPEEYVQRLAESPKITKIVHLVATLRQMIEIDGQPRLIVGLAPEATQSHLGQKSPMGYQIDQGKVFLGHVAAEGRQIGEPFEVNGKTFEIAHILPPHGTANEDIGVFMNLKDAQELLNKEGKISEILALGCKCKTVKRLEELTEELEAVLPEAKITELRLPAEARQEQRNLVEAHYAQMMQDYRDQRQKIVQQELDRREQILNQTAENRAEIAASEKEHRAQVIKLLAGLNTVVTPLLVFFCGLWVGLLAWSNVRERRTEIGLLRALGKRSSNIAALFLGKAVLLGFMGGILGCLLGYLAARWLAASMFDVAASNFVPSTLIAVCTLLGTPLVAAMASYLPTLSAINQDPAVVLMEN
jgi:cell division protein FtsX